METALKELAKLEKLTSSSRDPASKSHQDGKGKASIAISDSLDALLLSLHETKAMIEAGSVSNDTFIALSSNIDSRKKELDDRQKEIYNALARYGKALEKVREVVFWLISRLSSLCFSDTHNRLI
jgi:E3 ubiquitin-protein transferase RMND5